jgi:hypothetical protein
MEKITSTYKSHVVNLEVREYTIEEYFVGLIDRNSEVTQHLVNDRALKVTPYVIHAVEVPPTPRNTVMKDGS